MTYCPKSVEQCQPSRSSLTHTQRSWLTGSSNDCARIRAFWQILLNEVDEDSSCAVVGESLTKLDEGNGPGHPGYLSANSSQSPGLLVGRILLAIRTNQSVRLAVFGAVIVRRYAVLFGLVGFLQIPLFDNRTSMPLCRFRRLDKVELVRS